MPEKPRADVVKTEYLIDRHLVVLSSNGERHCACAEFQSAGECRHTRESEGRRAAQALIAMRVRSIDGRLIGFAHGHTSERTTKRDRPRSLALIRVR